MVELAAGKIVFVTGGASGIGGVAVQFSGAPCAPLCGVEN